ncbi:MAG: hypothetical protein R8F63_16420 [Acidimicrobiales bacterium]|nr:hypothetical protein [Acidimicrobiales bacterium]
MLNRGSNEWRIERAGDPGDFLEAARKVVECAQSDVRLFAVAVLKDRLPDIERDAVEQAIAAGASWARIAESLGVTRQAIYSKYGPRAEPTSRPRLRATVEARAMEATITSEQERYALAYFEKVRRRKEREADG